MLTYGAIILAITSFTFHKTSAVCCGPAYSWDLTFGYRCGSLGDNDWCCGKGPCNIFCCNCWHGLCKATWKKRSVGHETEEHIGAEKLFELVDGNRDNNVTMVEAGRYFQKQKNFKRTIDLQLKLEFKKIDVNDDGIISPAEFDESLKEKT